MAGTNTPGISPRAKGRVALISVDGSCRGLRTDLRPQGQLQVTQVLSQIHGVGQVFQAHRSHHDAGERPREEFEEGTLFFKRLARAWVDRHKEPTVVWGWKDPRLQLAFD